MNEDITRNKQIQHLLEIVENAVIQECGQEKWIAVRKNILKRIERAIFES